MVLKDIKHIIDDYEGLVEAIITKNCCIKSLKIIEETNRRIIWECIIDDEILVRGKCTPKQYVLYIFYMGEKIKIRPEECWSISEAISKRIVDKLKAFQKNYNQKSSSENSCLSDCEKMNIEYSNRLCEKYKKNRWSVINDILDKNIIFDNVKIISKSKSSDCLVWEAKDLYGDKIRGEIFPITSKVTIFFLQGYSDPIYYKKEKIEKFFTNQFSFEIREWTEKKNREIYNSSEYIDSTNSKSSCIYCHSPISSGSVCYSCANKYSKHRKGFGGYPSYDTHAEGSNGRSYLRY